MKNKITQTLFFVASLIISSCGSSGDNTNEQSKTTPSQSVEQKTEPVVQEAVKTPEEIQSEQKAEAERKKQVEKDDKIREKLKAQARRDWPDDYSTQEYWVTQEMEDYEYMKSIPDDDRIKKKAQQDWPLDFSTQKYWYNEQIAAKERMK